MTCCSSNRASIHLLKKNVNESILSFFYFDVQASEIQIVKENIKDKVYRHCDDHCDGETSY